MAKTNFWFVLTAMVFLSLALSACSGELERNPDGSLKFTTLMSEADLQEEIDQSLGFHGSQATVQADIVDGYIVVNVERERVQYEGVDTLSFRLDLGVGDGHLTATASDVVFNGFDVNPERIEQWNQNMAEKLAQAGGQRPNSTLQSVSVGSDAVTMVWRIETQRSQPD